MFRYELIDHPKSLSIDTAKIDTIFERLESTISKPQQGIITIICVSPEQIQTWNAKYRDKDAPTDILTFPYFDDASECESDEVVGEILICLDEVARKNEISQNSEEFLQAYYDILVHGLVHMMGYDHETDEDFACMERVEETVRIKNTPNTRH